MGFYLEEFFMMKSMFVSCALASLALSTMAEARYVGPVLVKETKTGFVLPEFAKAEKCEIFADRVVITTKFASGLQSVTTTPNSLQGDVQGLLQKASKGTQVKVAGQTDAPSVRHFGNIINPNDSVSYVGLTYENSATGEFIINQSAEARTLRFVIDTLCPNTQQGSTANAE
jgi:hypothetical protein